MLLAFGAKGIAASIRKMSKKQSNIGSFFAKAAALSETPASVRAPVVAAAAIARPAVTESEAKTPQKRPLSPVSQRSSPSSQKSLKGNKENQQLAPHPEEKDSNEASTQRSRPRRRKIVASDSEDEVAIKSETTPTLSETSGSAATTAVAQEESVARKASPLRSKSAANSKDVAESKEGVNASPVKRRKKAGSSSQESETEKSDSEATGARSIKEGEGPSRKKTKRQKEEDDDAETSASADADADAGKEVNAMDTETPAEPKGKDSVKSTPKAATASSKKMAKKKQPQQQQLQQQKINLGVRTDAKESTLSEKVDAVSKIDSVAADAQDTSNAAISGSAVSGSGGSSSSSQAAESSEAKHGDITFTELCAVFSEIESNKSRLKIVDLMQKFFFKVIRESPKNLLATVYLCINKIAPDYEGGELGIGEQVLLKAISSATGRDMKLLKTSLVKLGDLGVVAQESRGTQSTMFKPKPPLVAKVFESLKDIARASGKDSVQRKIDTIKGLLVGCSNNDSKFLIRLLEGKLRIGLAEKSVISSLAHAFVLNDQACAKLCKEALAEKIEEATAMIRSVYCQLPCYDIIIPALLEHGIFKLAEHCKLTPGIPLKPMLAHPSKSIQVVLQRFENIPFTCEWKYDGERAQVHKLPSGKRLIFSRNSENLTGKYPDVLERLEKAVKPGTDSFVLDCETVAWDKDQRKILPFQVLTTRKKKDVDTAAISVQVILFAFDLLYLNGKSLLQETFKERRRLLREHFQEVDDEFMFAKGRDANTAEEIEEELDVAIKGHCEGLMVKTLEVDSSYEPSKRSRNWLKVKKDYLSSSGPADSVDLVVIGGYYGRGKRTGAYGGFLLACYDDENEELQSITKIGTGLSDENLSSFYTALSPLVRETPKNYVRFGDVPQPDVWFEPTQVWEVKAADLSISPIYTAAAGLVDRSKGISLRFPRFIRVRDDKTMEQATSATQIAQMYRDQNLHQVAKLEDEDDF